MKKAAWTERLGEIVGENVADVVHELQKRKLQGL